MFMQTHNVKRSWCEEDLVTHARTRSRTHAAGRVLAVDAVGSAAVFAARADHGDHAAQAGVERMAATFAQRLAVCAMAQAKGGLELRDEAGEAASAGQE